MPYNNFLMGTIVHVKRVSTSPSFKGLSGSWIWSRFEWFRCRGGGVILSIVKKKKILMVIKFRLKQALTSSFFFIIYSAFGPHYFANAKWSLGPNFLYCTGWASWSTFHTLCWPQGRVCSPYFLSLHELNAGLMDQNGFNGQSPLHLKKRRLLGILKWKTHTCKWDHYQRRALENIQLTLTRCLKTHN